MQQPLFSVTPTVIWPCYLLAQHLGGLGKHWRNERMRILRGTKKEILITSFFSSTHFVTSVDPRCFLEIEQQEWTMVSCSITSLPRAVSQLLAHKRDRQPLRTSLETWVGTEALLPSMLLLGIVNVIKTESGILPPLTFHPALWRHHFLLWLFSMSHSAIFSAQKKRWRSREALA